MILGAIGAFVVDREFSKASAFALAGAVLTFFGFMHSEAIGLMRSPAVALSYLMCSGFLLGCAKLTSIAPAPRG